MGYQYEVTVTYVSQLLNVLRPGGGEHKGLPVRTDLADDLANLGLETHVKHAVCLVHDEVGDPPEVGLAGLKHIDETTRGGDDDLDATLEVTDLGTLGRTAVDSGVANAGVGAGCELRLERITWAPEKRHIPELSALLLDLNSKLTRGGENEGDGTVAGR